MTNLIPTPTYTARAVRRPARTRVPLRQSGRPAQTARRAVHEALTAWGCPDGPEQDAQLIVSELVANAAGHGGGALELTLSLDRHRHRIVIAVRDADPHLPGTPHDDGAELEESGRGLDIVGALAGLHGVTVDGGGKTVWAAVTVPSRGARAVPGPLRRALAGAAVLAVHARDLLI